MRLILAALLGLSAAICVAAQDKSSVKQNTREPDAPAPFEERKPEKAAGSSTVDAESTAEPGVAASYAYEFKQPEFNVSHILVEHDASGRGRVSFERKGEGEMIVEPLELSGAALTRITALWDALRFIDSKDDYQGDKQYPHLGTVRLSMKQDARERAAEFNWTTNSDAAALAAEYRRAADQAMFIFDITVARESQPLNAPKVMDHLDWLLSRNGLSDPQQLVALLRELNTDERIPLIARNHARRLLKKIEK
ncbi:MAG: hypothetical protein WCF57_22900 [Pyrinomonadaceae bacterium]